MNIAGLPLDPLLLWPHWLRPHWLWLLCAVPVLGWWWYVRQRARSAWRDHVDPHLLPRLLDGTAGRRARGGWLAMLGAVLAICALAGPAWHKTPQAQWQARRPLVIALDLSSATLAPDLPPSRLLQARAKIARLLATRAGGQVGLVAFADDAYTVAPLTDDAANVALFLDALSPDVMPVDGSRADRAIAWSARLLKQAGFPRGDILLLTDHADAPALRAAAAAHGDGARIAVLGLGTDAGAAYRDADGRIGHAQLDAPSLQALAAAGGGAYAALGVGDGDLAALGVLDPRSAEGTAGSDAATALWRDQGYWLVLPLLVLALFAFRRGGALAALLLLAWLPWQPAQAAGIDWWQRPDQRAQERFELGAQAYRQHDYAAAAMQWRTLPGADAAYNLGNALAEQGDYDGAIAAYDRALQLQPHMADAITNRGRVLAARQQQQQQQQEQQQKRQKQQQRQQKQQQGKQSGQQPDGQSPKQQAGQQGKQQGAQPGEDGRSQQTSPRPGTQRPQASPPSTTGQDAPAPDKPVDARRQQQADAAQRERMQESLHKSPADAAAAEKADGRGARVAQPGETPAERERRIANEAWLRRVPDDPGGLLRAKFRLEYERRQHEGDGP
jgi:Ca-activated chloride channel family protein